MATDSLERTVERLLAVHEIQQLMGKYEYYLECGMGEEIVGLFAVKTPGVTANIGDWGVFRGIDGVRRLFVGIISGMMKKPGCLAEADLTTPVIEIAGDRKTAKAVWLSPGFETTRDPSTDEIRAGWCWTKYACDFVKEDGEWKLWHWNNFLTFFSEYDKGWKEGGEHYTRQKGQEQAFPVELAPDGPPLHRHMPYSPDSAPHLLPAFPTPYETYDGSQDWIDPGRASLGNA
jgi:hypothetical protein